MKGIFAEDMTPETSFIKLGWSLGKRSGIEEVKKLMLTDVAGEISRRIDERSFLA